MSTKTTSSLSSLVTRQVEEQNAIPLITYDMNQGKYIINENAEAMLKKFEAPLGVISVAGMYRTGKSYLLNRMLLNRSGGFSVGPSINPCTKGLWIWSKPISGYSPDGTPINVLIIDTEGIGATDEDQNHDNKIITLAILLSSYFIFNSLGTIDENAIQNLSFIVNITKNIQLYNSKKEDVDPRDFAMYLPSFMWVIRDFSLQLIDQEGEPITSKEYLERSLELQKGFSESIETKNKIRTLIKEFFRDRDCVTLVRPLTEEGNLQNLEKMDSSKLRHEFLDQISQLKKKVLSKIRPKSLNGKVLTGEMFWNLMQSYVTAINNGAVPVIENAWSYMCKNECHKAMSTALTFYQKQMSDVTCKFPVNDNELHKAHIETKKSAIDLFSKQALGVYYEEYLKELKSQIKDQCLQLTIDNEKESKRKSEIFLNKNYHEIRQNAETGVYKTISEYRADIESFIEFVLENGPPGPNREIFLYQFIVNEILIQCDAFYTKNLADIEQLSLANQEQIAKLTATINEAKAEYDKMITELGKKNEIIKKLENEKCEVIKHGESNSDNLNTLLKEKNLAIEKLNEKIDALVRQNQKAINEMKSKVEFAETSSLEKERHVLQSESEFDKQKLLLEQKIKFLEKTLKETNDSHFNELKTYRKESITTNKDSIDKYESQIKSLSQKISAIQEKNIDLETKLLEKEKRLENEKSKMEEMIADYEKKLADLHEMNDMAENEMKSFELKQEREKEGIQGDYEEKMRSMNERKEEFERKTKENEDNLIMSLAKANKEMCLLKQNLEFAESQISELKSQFTEDKKGYDVFVKILEGKNQSLMTQFEDMVKQNSALKSEHSTEIIQLTNKYQASQLKLTKENEEIQEMITSTKNELAKQIQSFTTGIDERDTKISELNSKIATLEFKIEQYIIERTELIKSNKISIDELTYDFNFRLQQALQKCREDIEENNLKNEKIINEIRQHYEVERQAIEIKIAEEKEKNALQLTEMDNYYEEKIKELEKIKSERIEELEESLRDSEVNHDNYVIQTEQEIAVKAQQIESLNKFLADANQSLSTIHQAHQVNLDTQFERFKAEKESYNERITELLTENKKNEKEISVLSTKKEMLETNVSELNSQISLLKDTFEKDKADSNEKISQLTLKIEALNNELLVNKSEYSKEIALKLQEIEFLNARINELLKLIQDNDAKLEDKLNATRDLIINEYNVKIANMVKEREDIEAKLNQRKKEIKEMEINFTKEKNMLEKEKAVLMEKLGNMLQQKNELTETLEKEREGHDAKIQMLKNEKKRENEMALKENEVLKNKLKKIESDYTELSSNYEKDSHLWHTKFGHLEEQKNGSKADMNELQQKYEKNLDNLMKKHQMEKERFDQIHKEALIALEEGHKSQLTMSNQHFTSKCEELTAMNKNLTNENKNLIEKLSEYEKDGTISRSDLEKRLTIAVDAEIRLKKEIADISQESDKKISELNTKLDNERFSFNNKIIELENKLREYEGKRSNMVVDIVKQKAVSDKDKESKENEIQKLNDRILFLERLNMKIINENKATIRENEQLKKNKILPSSVISAATAYIPKMTRFYNTSNKENRNHSNSSFEKTYDKLDLLPVNKSKLSSKLSEKSEDDNNNGSLII